MKMRSYDDDYEERDDDYNLSVNFKYCMMRMTRMAMIRMKMNVRITMMRMKKSMKDDEDEASR